MSVLALHPGELDRRGTLAGALPCHACGLILRAPDAGNRDPICPRCGQHLHARKTNSLRRTTALLIAATALYIPANLLPVMNTTALFHTKRDTIMSGLVSLWRAGSWPIAILVFVASIVVPIFKIGALAILVRTAQRGSKWRQRGRTRLYRLIELVGRWSMLDIYAVTMLTATVRGGPLASVDAGPGAIPFAAVVVLTMLASMSFDPRLIWDEPAPRERV